MKDLNLVLRLRADGKGFVGEVKQSSQAVQQLGAKGQQTSHQLQGTGRQMDTMKRQTSALKGQVLALAGGFSALALGREMTRTLAQYQDMRTQITALVGGQQEWAETEQYLIGVSQEHSKVLTEMTGNYARLANLQEAGLLSLTETRQIFEGMSNVQSQTGATTVQLGQAMYGLSQALASPIVRAEELNQIVEPMPGLLNKLDKAAGLSAGGFRRMMLAGEVTSAFFKETLIKALADYDGAAARLAGNINAQAAAMENAWQQVVVAFEQPINDSVTPVLGAVTTGLNALAENVDTVNTVIGVTFAAALGRGSAALMVLSAEKLKAIAASRAKLAATIAEAQTEERLALAQKAAALTSVQAQAADARLTAARTTLAAATNTATVASRALGGAMALLGGPAGLVMMAVGALAYWITTSGDANKANEELAASTDVVNKKLSELTQNQLAAAQLQATKQIAAITDEVKALQSAIENNGKSVKRMGVGGWDVIHVYSQKQNEELIEQKAHLDTLNATLDEKKKRLADINTLMAGGKVEPETPDTPASDKQDAAQRLLANLRKQAALYGDTTAAAKVLYATQQGGLKGVNEALHPQLLAEAKKLDLLNAQKEAADAARQAEQQLSAMRKQAVLGDNATEVQKVQYEIDNGDLSGVDAGLQQAILAAAAQLDQQKAQQQADAFEQRTAAIVQQAEQEQAIAAAGIEAERVREEYAHEERMALLAEQFETAYAAASGNQALMDELESQYFLGREGLFQLHQNKLTTIEETENRRRRQLQMQQLQNYSTLFGSMADLTGAFVGKQSGSYKALFAISKAFSIAQSIMAIQTGIAEAWKLGWPLGIPAAATVVASTASIVSTIKGTQFQGQAHDGIGRVPSDNEGTWMLRRDEMVMNPQQTDNFNWMLNHVAQMQQAVTAPGQVQGGGMPLLIRFEGLPENFRASQSSDGEQLIALIQASDNATEERVYNRIAYDLATQSNAVGRAMGGRG